MAKTYTILNVEDLQNNRDLVRRILQSRGYEVVDAVNGLEGITKAVELEPDLILMDINLPDIDGFSVVTKIRSYAQLAEVPIVALTARNVANDQERAMAMGCDGYLSKPFGVKDLLAEVTSRVGKPRSHRQEEESDAQYLREQNVTLVAELEHKLTELRTAHEDLEMMHERLQRLDEAKTDFIHVASHELRTPLTMIHVYTDMLRTNPNIAADTTLTDMLDGLRKGVDRLSGIIDDMINIVRVELATLEVAYTPLSIKNVIEAVFREVKSDIAQRQQDLSLNLPDDLSPVVGDQKQLTQVFSRLMSNAIKYTPDQGAISVTARALTNSQFGSGEFVEVAVRDTGIGINREDQNHIFEKFYTAAEDSSLHSSSKSNFRGGGPGLGLTIAKGIVEAHGGRIWVESEGYDPDRNPGSTFHVLLPAYRQNDAPAGLR